jgi:hypothetical protein
LPAIYYTDYSTVVIIYSPALPVKGLNAGGRLMPSLPLGAQRGVANSADSITGTYATFDPEHVESVSLRNVGSTAHIHRPNAKLNSRIITFITITILDIVNFLSLI